MQQREFALYKRRLLSLIPGKLQDIPNREVKIKFFRSSLIEQIEKEKDWQFTGEPDSRADPDGNLSGSEIRGRADAV